MNITAFYKNYNQRFGIAAYDCVKGTATIEKYTPGVMDVEFEEVKIRDLEDFRLKNNDTCKFKLESEDENLYKFSCGLEWTFLEGGPKYNKMTFCPKCGKKIECNNFVERK